VAVTSIGTPVNTHSATGSVTATWGTGQARTAGNLLIAVVTAGASTSVTPIATVTTGWTQVLPSPNSISTVNVFAAMWIKPAAGADAAPVFTSTETGTAGGMDCMLFELNGGTVVTATGVYASGTVAGTLSAMLATTTGVAANANGYAISCFAQEAAAASLTFTGTGGFTKVLNGNGVSSVLQTYVGVYPNSPTGVVESDGGAFSTATSAFGCGLIVLVTAGPAAGRESYLDNATATVTTGGTTAPAAGTVETWTVNVTGAFPVARAGVSGGAFPISVAGSVNFHVADPVNPSEKFQVTTAPGGTGGAQSWTVSRGADGTTPVTHSAGFTIVLEVGAAALGNIPVMRTVTSPRYGARGDGGTDDTAAIQSALNDAAEAGGGKVYVPAGTFIVRNLTIDSYVTLEGSGRGTVLSAAAGTTGYLISLTNPATSQMTVVRNLTLWPEIAGCGGILLDNTGFGRVSDPQHVLEDLYVWQAGGDAYHFDNNARTIRVINCTQYACSGNGFYLGPGLASGGAGCTDSNFTECTSGPSGGHGFYLAGGWNCMFATCKAFYSGYNGWTQTWGTTQACFYISVGCNNTVFTSCSAQNAALHGWDLQSCEYIALTGCESDSNSSGASVTTGVGINTNSTLYCTIVGCTGYNSTGVTQAYGMQAAGTQTGTLFVANTVYGISGLFNWVSGGGYLQISTTTADFSGVGLVKVPSGTIIPGVALGTVTAGALENDGTAFYATAVASSRQVVDAEQFTAITGTLTLGTGTTLQKLFNATTNGTLTVPALTSYFFECEFDLTGMSGTTGTFSFGFGGTATLTSVKYIAYAQKTAAIGTPATAQMTVANVATATPLVSTSTTTTGSARISGIIRVNAAGTLIPSVALSVGIAAVVGVNSWFRITPVGVNTITNVGNWS
jgi:pectate lyase-like protein